VRRLKSLFKHHYWRVVALVGCLLAIAAAAVRPYSGFWAGTLAGIGGSVLATVVVNWVGPTGEEVYQRFLQLGVIDFYPSRNKVPSANWVTWLGATKHRCVLLGIANGEWCHEADFPTALRGRLQAEVRVQVYFLNPKGPAADVRAKEEATQGKDTKNRIRWAIDFMWKQRQGLAPNLRDRFQLYVYDATPSFGVSWFDDSMLVTHYLAGFINLTSPALMIRPDWPESGTLYAVYQNNVSSIQRLALEITDHNVHEYTEP